MPEHRRRPLPLLRRAARQRRSAATARADASAARSVQDGAAGHCRRGTPARSPTVREADRLRPGRHLLAGQGECSPSEPASAAVRVLRRSAGHASRAAATARRSCLGRTWKRRSTGVAQLRRAGSDSPRDRASTAPVGPRDLLRHAGRATQEARWSASPRCVFLAMTLVLVIPLFAIFGAPAVQGLAGALAVASCSRTRTTT